MASNNLRPDLEIEQKFITAAPLVPASTLPLVLVGLNRDLRYRELTNISAWNGGSAAADVDFPGWLGGAVEDSDTAETELAPIVEVYNTVYGWADITADVTFKNMATAPLFDIASGADAVFEIASGTTGAFAVDTDAPVASAFTDTNADFVADRVAGGDVIKVDGIATYEVNALGLTSDTELSVRRMDKGPSTAGAAEAAKVFVTQEDTNDVRTVYNQSAGFTTAGGFSSSGVAVGDLVRLDHWNVVSQITGILYEAVGSDTTSAIGAGDTPAADERYVTQIPSSTVNAWNNTTFSGGVFFTANADGDLMPAFYLTHAMGGELVAIAKDFATNHLVDYEDADTGVKYALYDYTYRTASASTTGAFTADNGGYRTFTDASLGNFESPSGVNIGDHIAIKDTDGVYRPVFEVVGFGDEGSPTSESPDTDATLAVQPFGDILGASVAASNVSYVILGPSEVQASAGATVSAEGADAYGSTTRLLEATGEDFNADGVVAGDLVFSESGTLMFSVVQVGDTVSPATYDTLVVVDHPNAGTVLAPTDTLTNFGFSVRSSLRSDFQVKRVVNADTLAITALSTSPNAIPGTRSIRGAIYFQTPPSIAASPDGLGSNPVLVTAGDSASALSYTIEKTLSGAALEGDIYVTYAEVLDGSASTLLEFNSSTYEDVLGAAVPGNPLGLAGSIAAQQTDQTMYAIQVTADTSAAWQAALEVAKTDTVYSLVPLTQNDTYLALFQSHVTSQSLPANKRERILWQSKWFKTQLDRTAYDSAVDTALATVSRTVLGVQTLTVYKDVVALDVIVGDTITMTTFDGTAEVEVTGRITDIDNTTPSIPVLTMVPDGNVPLSTTDLTVLTYDIKSKSLSQTELKNTIVSYLTSLSERRHRNIFPSRYQVTFTDSTGFYDTGLGDVADYEVGGQYQCVIEAGKRQRRGPAQPLTKISGSGIQLVLDPFSNSVSNQDEIINAGGYYIEQPGGEGGTTQAIRALTTDVTTLTFAEESVTSQVDNFSRKLRAVLKPILGPYILDEGFYTLVSTLASGVVNDVVGSKELKSAVLLSITEDDTAADSFVMSYQVGVWFSGARGTITIYV